MAPDCHVQAVDSDSLLRSGTQQVQEVHLDASDTELQLQPANNTAIFTLVKLDYDVSFLNISSLDTRISINQIKNSENNANDLEAECYRP